MTWDDIIQQQQVVATLRAIVASDRVPHSLLFHGPDGTGKRAVALALAQTLQCERGGDAPCNECHACSKVSRLIHPDVRVLMPYPTDVDDSDLAERLPLLAADPYATVDFVRRPSLSDLSASSNKQATYPVERVHERLLRPMRFQPLEGRVNVAIVTDADAMNRWSANALLKLLEEPPPGSLFILTTRSVELLLPTVISRCQRFRFDPLDADHIEEALVRRKGTDPTRAALIARMADGSYGRALELIESDDLAHARDRVVAFLRGAYGGDTQSISEIIAWIGSQRRDRMKMVLGLMLGWVRDLVLYRAVGPAAPIVNVDQRDTIARFCKNLPDADLDAVASAIEEAIRLIDRNVKIDLIMIGLGHLFRRVARGERAQGLFVPLSEAL